MPETPPATPAAAAAARVCVGALLQRADGRVLLALRSVRRPWYPGVWDVPGGHCEPGERPEEALVREVREELGVTALAWQLLTTVRPAPHPADAGDGAAGAPRPVVLHVYRVVRWAGVPANREPAEHRAVAWVAPARAARLALADPALGALLRALPPAAPGPPGRS